VADKNQAKWQAEMLELDRKWAEARLVRMWTASDGKDALRGVRGVESQYDFDAV
jgi:hypothetical protein